MDGQNTHLTIGQNEAETRDLLLRILGDEKAAGSLAQLVHMNVNTQLDIPNTSLPTENIGIWIDPIGK